MEIKHQKVTVAFDETSNEPVDIQYDGDLNDITQLKEKLTHGIYGHRIDPNKAFPNDIAFALIQTGAVIDTSNFAKE